jgi:hypothetical protein
MATTLSIQPSGMEKLHPIPSERLMPKKKKKSPWEGAPEKCYDICD